MVTSSGGLSSGRRTRRTTYPTARPTAIPPTIVTRRSHPADQTENAPVTAARSAVRRSTSAVPSLTRLSPSTMSIRRRGTPRRRPIAVAAIGSVGETTAPSTNASGPADPSRLVRDDRDAGRRRGDDPQGEERDRPKVVAQLAQPGRVRGHVEQRRQDPDEDELRRHRDRRDARCEPEQEAAEDEQDRVRDAERPGQDQQGRSRDQEREELQLLFRTELEDHRDTVCARRSGAASSPGGGIFRRSSP